MAQTHYEFISLSLNSPRNSRRLQPGQEALFHTIIQGPRQTHDFRHSDNGCNLPPHEKKQKTLKPYENVLWARLASVTLHFCSWTVGKNLGKWPLYDFVSSYRFRNLVYLGSHVTCYGRRRGE